MKTPEPPRTAGILAHVTSLPSAYGIGDLGPTSRAWVDRLAKAKQTWWQLLPLNLPVVGDSPYSCHSAFAGNVYLLSPDDLATDGLLDADDLKSLRAPATSHVDFAAVRRAKDAMIARLAERFAAGDVSAQLRGDYRAFCKHEASWLDDFALFMALREHHPDVPWTHWPKRIVRRESAAIDEIRGVVEPIVERHRVAQFLFFRQLDALREHARSRGVKLLGDVPIYVSLDSADVWANPHLFQLDASRKPTRVAGVPPDFFSKTGQRWGNPLYRWDAMAADGFAWWIARLRAALRQADVVRLDHFRALAAYWSVPADAPDARNGKWVDAPGEAFLTAIRDAFDGLPLVAEDLGMITPDVITLRKQFALPGMQVLLFAFGGPPMEGSEPPAFPHTMPRDVIVYSGNHDTDTTGGWYASAKPALRAAFDRYAPDAPADPAWAMIRLAWMSVADTAIAPVQDVLSLGSEARMNTPGSTSANWSWRMMRLGDLDKPLRRLAEWTTMYGRAATSRSEGKP